MIVSPSSTTPFFLRQCQALNKDWLSTYGVLGLAGDACQDPVYRIFNQAVHRTASKIRRYSIIIVNLRPLMPSWNIARALSTRNSRHACDQAASDSLTNCKKHRITLNHQHRHKRHRGLYGSRQSLAHPMNCYYVSNRDCSQRSRYSN